MNDRDSHGVRALSRAVVCLGVVAFVFGPTSAASAHAGEEDVPAITDVQEGIAILAEHPGEFPAAEVTDHAMDKVGDALESNDARGVRLDLVQQAKDALDAGRNDEALTLLERSIGACPGAPVIEPQDAPRRPPALSSPCPSLAHLQGLDRSPIGGAKEPVLLAVGGVLILAGLALARRVR
ncbi:MAG: hypothetical protein M3P43_15615 [Actinomycetota bacterium]|nr:hypothetical protein [Actinomycetota bacterium]